MQKTQNLMRAPPSLAEFEREEGVPISVAGALFTATQRRLLGFLFGQPDRAFYMQELFECTGTGNGSVQRELRRLEEATLVISATECGRKYYQANAASASGRDLTVLVQNSFGMAEPLREAFSGIERFIELLFAYQPIPDWWMALPSIDLLLVLKAGASLPPGREVLDALDDASARLRRGCTLARTLEARTLAQPDFHLAHMLARPRVWVFGSEEALASMR